MMTIGGSVSGSSPAVQPAPVVDLALGETGHADHDRFADEFLQLDIRHRPPVREGVRRRVDVSSRVRTHPDLTDRDAVSVDRERGRDVNARIALGKTGIPSSMG